MDAAAVDSTCYRKVVFRASIPAPLLTLYLTPDGKHLVSGLMDVMADPAIVQRKQQEELEAQLTTGALLQFGENTAPARLVVFSDFQCPYCKRLAEVLQQLPPEKRAHLQITYRQLPLNIHSWARDAAELSTCVALQDKTAFWKLHDFFFARQEDLSKEVLKGKVLELMSQETTFNPKTITACLSGKTYDAPLHRDEQLAQDLGITSTPSVFLNGRRISVRSVNDLLTALEAAERDNAAALHDSPRPASETDKETCAPSADSRCASSKPLGSGSSGPSQYSH